MPNPKRTTPRPKRPTTHDTSNFKCNMCGSPMTYHAVKETHLWVCPDCPNVQFEYYSALNTQQVAEFLEK